MHKHQDRGSDRCRVENRPRRNAVLVPDGILDRMLPALTHAYHYRLATAPVRDRRALKLLRLLEAGGVTYSRHAMPARSPRTASAIQAAR